MANELTNAIKSAASKVAQYVDDLSRMTVETRYVDLEAQSLTFDTAKAVARTDLRMDGDCTTVLPMRQDALGAQSLDGELFQAHQQVVATAIEYRARMIGSLMGLFRPGSQSAPAPQMPSPTFPPQTTDGLPKG